MDRGSGGAQGLRSRTSPIERPRVTQRSESVRTGLDRAVSVLRGVGQFAARLGIAALVAGAITWWALWDGLGATEDRTTLLIVAAVLLAFPPAALLYVFWVARQLSEVPARIRTAPANVRGRVEDIRRRAGEAADARRRGAIRRGAAVYRLWRAIASLREEMRALSSLVATPGSLILGLVAGAFAGVEILAGLGALVWFALR
jgi:hypothetical protein